MVDSTQTICLHVNGTQASFELSTLRGLPAPPACRLLWKEQQEGVVFEQLFCAKTQQVQLAVVPNRNDWYSFAGNLSLVNLKDLQLQIFIGQAVYLFPCQVYCNDPFSAAPRDFSFLTTVRKSIIANCDTTDTANPKLSLKYPAHDLQTLQFGIFAKTQSFTISDVVDKNLTLTVVKNNHRHTTDVNDLTIEGPSVMNWAHTMSSAKNLEIELVLDGGQKCVFDLMLMHNTEVVLTEADRDPSSEDMTIRFPRALVVYPDFSRISDVALEDHCGRSLKVEFEPFNFHKFTMKLKNVKHLFRMATPHMTLAQCIKILIQTDMSYISTQKFVLYIHRG